MTTDYNEKNAVWPRVASADALIEIMENDDFTSIVHARENFNKFINAGKNVIPKQKKKDAMVTIRKAGGVEAFVKAVAFWVWDTRLWETQLAISEAVARYHKVAYERMMAN